MRASFHPPAAPRSAAASFAGRCATPRRVGLDFDNTIAGYDHGFGALARREGLVPEGFVGSKAAVKRAVCAAPDGELAWMRLQGQAYGRCMGAAVLLPGVRGFLEACRARDIALYVVSHKTRFGHFDPERVDLRQAALAWMRAQGLFEIGLRPERVSFHDTRAQKLARIEELELDLFVDDLLPVLTDAAFPGRTRAMHFDGEGRGEARRAGLEGHANWERISQAVLDLPPVVERGTPDAIAAWCGVEPRAVRPVGGTGNNRMHRVRRSGGWVAVKSYLADEHDRRDRFGAEQAALAFLGQAGVREVPQLRRSDRRLGLLEIEWVTGQPVSDPSEADVVQALSFVGRLRDLARQPAARELPLASEACLSAQALIEQVRARLERLSAVACLDAPLEQLLTNELWPAFERESERVARGYASAGQEPAQDLAPERRTLSPSDFGFHNALRRPDGSLVFLDFEYFGQDDPVKLVADFLLHPRHEPHAACRRAFLRRAAALFGGDPFFRRRLGTLYRLYALRWCAILLNVHLPSHAARLAWAGTEGQRTREAQRAKVERLLPQLHSSPIPVDEP